MNEITMNVNSRHGILRRIKTQFEKIRGIINQEAVVFAFVGLVMLALLAVIVIPIVNAHRVPQPVKDVRHAVQNASVTTGNSPASMVSDSWLAAEGNPTVFLRNLGIDGDNIYVTYESSAGTANDQLALTGRGWSGIRWCVGLPKSVHGVAIVERCG